MKIAIFKYIKKQIKKKKHGWPNLVVASDITRSFKHISNPKNKENFKMWLKPSCSCICLLTRWVCITIMTGMEIVSRDNFFPSDPTQKVRALCSASKFKIKREGFLHRGSFCCSFYWLLAMMMNRSDLIFFPVQD